MLSVRINELNMSSESGQTLNYTFNQQSQKTQKLTSKAETTQNILNDIKNFSNVCRTCANVTEFVIPIFAEEGLQNNLAEKIHKHLPIKVSEEDDLPHVVCYQCASTLLAWHNLVECCVQADADLRQRLTSLTEQCKSSTNGSQSIEESEGINTDVPLVKVKEETIDESNTPIELQIKCDDIHNAVLEKPPVYVNNGKRYVVCYYCKKHVRSESWQRHVRSHQNTKIYSCHICGLGFNDKSNLSRHTQAVHKKHRPHVCPVCNQTFSRKTHLQDHIESHSNNRDYICDVCGKASKSSTALRMHKRMHKESFKFQCIFCDARFKRKNQLIAHVSIHTGEKAHICECGKAFRFNNNEESVVQMSETRRWENSPGSTLVPMKICDYCNSDHPEAQYKEHLISTHSELLFHCDECDNYVDRKNFIEHMSQHAGEYATNGDEEEPVARVKRTKTKKDANANTEIESTSNILTNADSVNATDDDIDTNTNGHNIPQAENRDNDFSDHSDAEYFCELPKSVFEAIEDSQDTQTCGDIERASQNDASEAIDDRNKNNDEIQVPSPTLATKIDNKRDKKARNCPICFKVYTANSSYFYHLKYSHKNDREHECDVCGKKFSAKPTLAQHLLLHTGDYPYECKECGKKFRARASLYIHEQIHVGLKTFSCTVCHKSFRWRAHLDRHRKRHEGRRSHVCGTCGRGFAVHCDLLRHARTHAAGTFECDRCGLKFAQSRYMKTHMIKKHST